MEELSDWPARIRKTCWFHAGDGIIDGLRSRHDSTPNTHFIRVLRVTADSPCIITTETLQSLQKAH